jgi:hypothetical protein
MPGIERLASLADDVLLGARLLRRMPGWLRRPVRLDQARTALGERLRRRPETFLATVQRGIFAHPRRPYARLLALAGCEYGDLARLVRDEGLEAALATLFRHGVYLTVDELKGRRPIRRGSASFEVAPHELRNPLVGRDLVLYTGGSRGPRTPVPVVLDFLRDRAVDQRIETDARGAARWRNAVWTVPGGMPLALILWYAAAGLRMDRWFLQIDPRTSGLPSRYLWAQRVLRLGGLLAGVDVPEPTRAPIDDPLPVARWMTECLARGQTPHLWSFPSSVLRLCRAAEAAGVDLRGAQFTVSGEPLTAVRVEAIERLGARVSNVYGTAETYAIGLSCQSPEVADDMHVVTDLGALIETGGDGSAAGFPTGALLFTSLRPTAPMLLINASLGDQGRLTERACGCALGAHGWTRHVSEIRSFEKLNAGGVTFLDVDVAAVLDAVLPGRFGGGPADYQLLEEEGTDGQPRLTLLVDPRLGPLDAAEVVETFLRAIAEIGDAERVAQLQWRQGGWLGMRRERPRLTEAGKVLHLHHRRRAPPA